MQSDFRKCFKNQWIFNDFGLRIDCNHASNIHPPHAHVATLTSMQKCGIVQNPLVFKANPCPGRVRRRAFYTNPDAVGKRHCTILLPSTFSNNAIKTNVFLRFWLTVRLSTCIDHTSTMQHAKGENVVISRTPVRFVHFC